ncbi:MAG: hypothetical protein H0X70_07975 [Segetibacter sp.]|nr:hypothetical protein [Segetibacter sp.]
MMPLKSLSMDAGDNTTTAKEKGRNKGAEPDNLNFRKDGLSARQLAFQNRKALIISNEKKL